MDKHGDIARIAARELVMSSLLHHIWTVAGYTMFIIAWSAFVVSFFLPASALVAWPGEGETLKGWQAMIEAYSALAMLLLGEVRATVVLLFPLINGMALIAPLFVFAARRSAPFLAVVLGVCGIVPWCLPPILLHELRVGFYIWDASFFVMALGCIVLAAEDMLRQVGGRVGPQKGTSLSWQASNH